MEIDLERLQQRNSQLEHTIKSLVDQLDLGPELRGGDPLKAVKRFVNSGRRRERDLQQQLASQELLRRHVVVLRRRCIAQEAEIARLALVIRRAGVTVPVDTLPPFAMADLASSRAAAAAWPAGADDARTATTGSEGDAEGTLPEDAARAAAHASGWTPERESARAASFVPTPRVGRGPRGGGAEPHSVLARSVHDAEARSARGAAPHASPGQASRAPRARAIATRSPIPRAEDVLGSADGLGDAPAGARTVAPHVLHARFAQAGAAGAGGARSAASATVRASQSISVDRSHSAVPAGSRQPLTAVPADASAISAEARRLFDASPRFSASARPSASPLFLDRSVAPKLAPERPCDALALRAPADDGSALAAPGSCHARARSDWAPQHSGGPSLRATTDDMAQLARYHTDAAQHPALSERAARGPGVRVVQDLLAMLAAHECVDCGTAMRCRGCEDVDAVLWAVCGLELAELDAPTREARGLDFGIAVHRVREASPAECAGVCAGDVLASFAERAVVSLGRLREALLADPGVLARGEVPCILVRGGTQTRAVLPLLTQLIAPARTEEARASPDASPGSRARGGAFGGGAGTPDHSFATPTRTPARAWQRVRMAELQRDTRPARR